MSHVKNFRFRRICSGFGAGLVKRGSLIFRVVLAAVLAFSLSSAVFAQTLDEAARQAARQHDAKVLSARTVEEGSKRVHVIKLLTSKGVVKTVRVTVRER
jgi:hypothetical protein